MHRRSFSLLALSMASAAPMVVSAQPRTLTAADYARAEKFLAPTVSPLVANAGVQPRWLPDGRFTYRVRRADGSSPLTLVDAKGVKTDCDANPSVCPTEPARPSAPRRAW